MRTRSFGALIASLALAAGALVAAPADATSGVWQNCTHVNKRYHHGVGKRHAHDHTSGTAVTNFKRSNKLFATAMSHNRGLDRDHDHIACEKH